MAEETAELDRLRVAVETAKLAILAAVAELEVAARFSAPDKILELVADAQRHLSEALAAVAAPPDLSASPDDR